MKYCPYCGAVLPDSSVSFCPECGESLAGGEVRPMEKERTPKKQKPPKAKKVKKKRPPKPDTPSPVDDYDGYYNDRLPMDEGHRRDGLDRAVIKKVVALVIALIVVIGACLALLYVI